MSGEIKESLRRQMLRRLELDETLVRTSIVDLQEALALETRSSAGDKYETGRAMIRQELDKQEAQMEKIRKQKSDLAGLDLSPDGKAGPGSLVHTQEGSYFISLAMGKLETPGFACYAVSPASPVGKALSGKQAGDRVLLQDRELRIVSVE